MGSLGDKGTPFKKGRSAYGLARGVLGKIEAVFLAFGAICVLAFGAYINLGIILRNIFNGQIYDEVVIVGELMVGALVLPLAYVAADRGYIAVEVLTAHFGRKIQIWLNVLVSFVGLIAVSLISYAAYHAFFTAIEDGNYFFGLLELPEWPGRLAFFAGYLLFFIRLINLLVFDFCVAVGVLDDPGAINGHDISLEDPA